MKAKAALFIDDDTKLVMSSYDLLRETCRNYDTELLLFTSLDQIWEKLEELKSSHEIVACVLDLWLVDKSKNIADPNAGMRILDQLRKYWNECYVIVFSAHLNNEVQARLSELSNIAIVAKPVPTWVITDILEQVFESLAACA